jgi:hypothetical protein
VNPFGLEAVGRAFNYFDTVPLVTLARRGVDFGAVGLEPGLVPVGSDRGTPEQWDRFRNIMLPEMVASQQARCVVEPGERARVILHPIAIEDKAKPPPGQPQKSRMIHNLAGRLRCKTSGRRFKSFSDSTPHEELPSVPLARISDIIFALVLLESLGFRATVHGGTVDLQAAYYQVA